MPSSVPSSVAKPRSTNRRERRRGDDGAPGSGHGLDLYEQMLLIRRFEERTEEQYTRARIGGYCHLAIGEEAANVGAIEPLGAATTCSRATATTAPRWPSAPIRPRVMAELFGKAPASRGGFGGSMHLLDVERNFLGGWGIVGGAAADRRRRGAGARLQRATPNAVLCQLGDGATNIGAFHEALNLAAIWDLPIVFQVINNQYGMGTTVERASAEPELYKRAAAYRMHGERVDGNDVEAVCEAADRLLRAGARGAQAGAARDADLPLPRPLRGRRGQGLPLEGRGRVVARARPDRRCFGQRLLDERACVGETRSRIEVSTSRSRVGEAVEAAGASARAASTTLVRQRLRRRRHRRAVRAHGSRRPVRRAGARSGRSSADERHAPPGTDVTYREALRRALDEELLRDERVFLMGEEIGASRAPTRSRPGCGRSTAREARARDADLRGGLRRRRHRRGDARPAAGRRDHDHQLHPRGDGHGREPRGQGLARCSAARSACRW